jgi:hypothetical protein
MTRLEDLRTDADMAELAPEDPLVLGWFRECFPEPEQRELLRERAEAKLIIATSFGTSGLPYPSCPVTIVHGPDVATEHYAAYSDFRYADQDDRADPLFLFQYWLLSHVVADPSYVEDGPEDSDAAIASGVVLDLLDALAAATSPAQAP